MSDTVATEDRPPNPSVTKPSSARSALNFFAMRVVTLPLTVVTSVLVARTLGPEDRGIYGFLLLFGTFALPILMFGFGSSVVYLVSSKRYRPTDIYVTCVLVGLLQGAVAAISLGSLWKFDLLGETVRNINASLLVPILLSLPLLCAIHMSTRVALGDSWFTLLNRVMLATALITGGMLLIVVVIARLGVQGAVVGLVVKDALLLSGNIVASVLRYRPEFAVNIAFLREAWPYGLKAWVADLTHTTNLRMDQWILGMNAAPAVLGIYGPAVVISELLWMVPDSLGFVLFNKIAAAHDPEQQAQLVDRLHRTVFWTMVLAGTAVAASGPWLVTLAYGTAFAEAAIPLALLMPGTVAFSVYNNVLTQYFGATGRPHYGSTCGSVGAAAGFLLYILLIPTFGAVGAAVASSGCYAATAITAVLLYRRLTAPHKPRLFQVEKSDIAWLKQQVRLTRARRHTAN